jgi:hypothetical protein
VVCPDPLSVTPLTSSATKTPDDTEEDHDDPEQQRRSTKMQYSSDELYNPSIGAITKNYT